MRTPIGFRCALAAALLFLVAPDAVRAVGPWDTDALQAAPEVFPAPGFEEPGVRALFYAGRSYRGKPTRVFAWYGAPPRKEGTRLPAMVLVHGGGGTAFAEWVRLWTERGYAAIAMDLCGATPGGSHSDRPRHEWGGPPGWGGFDQVDAPTEDQWTYHAIADVVLANSLLRSFGEIDPERIGLTGISWGGYLTCIASAVDSRFRFAVPVYGCGFLGENSCWLPTFDGMGKESAKKWLDLWDPSRYLGETRMPILWVTGTNDFAYPLDSLQKSYRLPRGDRMLSVRVRMPHAHGGPGENPEEIHALANAVLKDGVPLARVLDAKVDGDRLEVAFEAQEPIVRCEVPYTCDGGPWKDRRWDTVVGTIDSERSIASATVPEGATVFYMNLVDSRGLVVSSEHGERPPLEARKELDRALQSLHRQYDPDERMIRRPFSSPGYHTTLTGGTVHPTRDSLNYAVGLLDTGEERWRLRAVDILRRVIALQDKDPESRTYGIWSWFLEEPLDRMSPPDWNWADFCGTQLLQVILDHRHRLPDDLRGEIDPTIRHAARSIQRRNVGPGYTNIAIMGTYVTLVAAETYGIDDLRSYALARLARFLEYTRTQGAFTEYNSPTYTVVALEELGRLRLHVKDPEARSQVDEIYRLAWEEIAQHFHPPTRQWAGPHSRCYRTLLGDRVPGLIERATDGRVAFGVDSVDLNACRLPLPCPKDLESYFTTLAEPRELVKTFQRGAPAIVGTTYLTPNLALGSVNVGDLWNQRRPLVGYWGTAEHPSYLQVRLLHDGYDFSAGQLFSAQRKGRVLAAVVFATDGGDTHVSLDRLKDGVFRARDLRLRFELGGAAGALRPELPAAPGAPATIDLGGLKLHVVVPYATFGEGSGRWELGCADGKAWLDVVILSGDEREIRLADVKRAAIGFGVAFTASEEPAPEGPHAEVADERLELHWDGSRLSVPVAPARIRELRASFSTE